MHGSSTNKVQPEARAVIVSEGQKKTRLSLWGDKMEDDNGRQVNQKPGFPQEIAVSLVTKLRPDMLLTSNSLKKLFVVGLNLL